MLRFYNSYRPSVAANIFISYRRSDAADAARALCMQLRTRFGASKVFMDESSIQPGDTWPSRIQLALEGASVVLALMGRQWLTAADEWGRRRIDAEGDWVRLELSESLAAGRTVIPIFLGGMTMPPKEVLPSSVQALCDQQAYIVGDAHWDDDVQSLCQHLKQTCGFQALDPDVVLPQAAPEKKRLQPLTEAELFEALKALPHWEPVESSIPSDYPHTRLELRRTFRFLRFKDAIAFLQTLVQPLNTLNHHPRIENQWRTVFIHFSTWDAGNRLTQRDIDAAKQVEDVHRRFQDELKAQR